MADERTNEEKGIPAVSLPAGQFELKDLEKALDSAVGVKDRDQHPERINKAIVDTIQNPELLANLDRPSVPTGASLRETELVYVEGTEPVKAESVVFDPVDAKDGEEASKMRYDPRGEATDKPLGAEIAEDAARAGEGEQTASLSELAHDAVESDTAKAGRAETARSSGASAKHR